MSMKSIGLTVEPHPSLISNHQRVTEHWYENLLNWLKEAKECRTRSLPFPDIQPIIGTFPVGRTKRGHTYAYRGLIGLRIPGDNGFHYYDPATLVTIRLLTAFGGKVILKHNRQKHYSPILSFKGVPNWTSKSGSDHVPIDRITMNAPEGKAVTQSHDYRNRSFRVLGLRSHSSAHSGRHDALQMALEAFDRKLNVGDPAFTTRLEYEEAIKLAYSLIRYVQNRVLSLTETAQKEAA